MNTKALTALALSAIIAGTSIGMAAPAMASDSTFDSDYYLAQLRYDGVNAIRVDQEDGQTILATIVGPNGHTSYAYFDKDTLAPVKR